jgi:hypothetical protein
MIEGSNVLALPEVQCRIIQYLGVGEVHQVSLANKQWYFAVLRHFNAIFVQMTSNLAPPIQAALNDEITKYGHVSMIKDGGSALNRAITPKLFQKYVFSRSFLTLITKPQASRQCHPWSKLINFARLFEWFNSFNHGDIQKENTVFTILLSQSILPSANPSLPRAPTTPMLTDIILQMKPWRFRIDRLWETIDTILQNDVQKILLLVGRVVLQSTNRNSRRSQDESHLIQRETKELRDSIEKIEGNGMQSTTVSLAALSLSPPKALEIAALMSKKIEIDRRMLLNVYHWCTHTLALVQELQIAPTKLCWTDFRDQPFGSQGHMTGQFISFLSRMPHQKTFSCETLLLHLLACINRWLDVLKSLGRLMTTIESSLT